MANLFFLNDGAPHNHQTTGMAFLFFAILPYLGTPRLYILRSTWYEFGNRVAPFNFFSHFFFSWGGGVPQLRTDACETFFSE